jgi:hypothetical protein
LHACRSTLEDPPAETPSAVTLSDHQREVARWASQIAALAEPKLQAAFEIAGWYHDEGKKLPLWQTAMACPDGQPLAKSKSRFARPRALGGFRHELLSLKEARPRVRDLPEEQADLALHLIASHHGYARPYFPARACGPEPLEDEAREALERFARLQRRLGPWRLAYLEALFRSADWLASRGVTPTPEEASDDEG